MPSASKTQEQKQRKKTLRKTVRPASAEVTLLRTEVPAIKRTIDRVGDIAQTFQFVAQAIQGRMNDVEAEIRSLHELCTDIRRMMRLGLIQLNQLVPPEPSSGALASRAYRFENDPPRPIDSNAGRFLSHRKRK